MTTPDKSLPGQGSDRLHEMQAARKITIAQIYDALAIPESLAHSLAHVDSRQQATEELKATPFAIRQALVEMIDIPVQLQRIRDGVFTPNYEAQGMDATEYARKAAHDVNELASALDLGILSKTGFYDISNYVNDPKTHISRDDGRKHEKWELDIAERHVINILSNITAEKPDINHRQFAGILREVVVPYFQALTGEETPPLQPTPSKSPWYRRVLRGE